MTYDWQWKVAVTVSSWSPDRRALTDRCLSCQAFGLEYEWPSKSAAATDRWVAEHSRWHNRTDRPGPMIRPLEEKFASWDR